MGCWVIEGSGSGGCRLGCSRGPMKGGGGGGEGALRY